MTDLVAAGDFTILAVGSTDKADCLHISIFIHFDYAFENKPIERFLGIIVKLTTSEKAVDLQSQHKAS